MNRTRKSLEMNKTIGIGSWLRFTSEFWRCSLSMNRPSPGLRPPSPRLAGRGQGEGRPEEAHGPNSRPIFWRCSLSMNFVAADVRRLTFQMRSGECGTRN